MERKLLNEISRIKKLMYLNESINLSSKTLICVDIQPEYKDGIYFNINDWVKMINSLKNNRLIFLYNGADTLGMISESDYINWLFELGIKEKVLNNSIFYDKGYAFFRYCMDNGTDEDQIVELVKFMYENDINDSRDLDKEMWDRFTEETKNRNGDIRDLMEVADDCLSIPDLMNFLQGFGNIVLCGGGEHECLKEVEIALQALDKPFERYNQFIYENQIDSLI